MKVAVFGMGSMGQRHAANAAALGHDVAVYDPDPAITSTSTGVTVFDMEISLLAWKPEAIVVASPVREHARQAWAGLRLGAGVLVEKPLAESTEQFWASASAPQPDDARVLLEAVRVQNGWLSGRTQMVGYNLRFHAGFAHVRRVLARRVGPVAYAHVWVRCDRTTWPGHAYGSTLLECSHEIDLALWLLGPARAVPKLSARSSNQHWHRIVLQHDSGAQSIVDVQDDYQGYWRGGIIVGSHGTVEWRWHAGATDTGEFVMHGSGYDWQEDKILKVLPDDTYRAEMKAFLASAARCELGSPHFMDGIAVLDVLRHVGAWLDG